MVENNIKDILLDKKSLKDFFIKKLELKHSVPLVVFVVDSFKNDGDIKIIDDIVSVWEETESVAIVLDKANKIVYEKKYVKTFDYNENNEAKLLVAADIVVDFTGIKIETLLFNRVVAISKKIEGLRDYSPISEKGNSFLYKQKNSVAIFGAISRALETSKLKYDWRHIVKNLV